ncbi:hypothetical protein [Flavobacterium sp. ZE23DGlu08]|uniref:hypothetical protein n=1 Tax=Flavobacterium sp. ZE23DGlu08 TaxID=3059026 RepID=UPI00265DAF3D|nr:hypothetical protein [Flavobacterium sp. ZE23DGlu08]WKL44896.1 hypothetical protein Q1W72_04615 [Flavobacterium sp. ZE23DGlu08]
MTANLAYQIIMSLPENERELLFEMIDPHMKKFDLEELLSDEIPKKISEKEMMLRLIETCFSKVKNS